MKAIMCAAVLVACSGTSRGLEAYRSDTQKLLATRDTQLKQCYDDALKADAKLGGDVTVRFVVAKKTGLVTGATVTPATAGPLGKCVLDAVNGLKLDPPDRNEGQATFVYAFKPSST